MTTINRTLALLALLTASIFCVSASATQTLLFSETFDSVNDDFSGHDPRLYGVPTAASFNTDENWYGVRFERPDGGTIAQDVGVQENGGYTNPTPTGFAEDDAGLMFRFDASLYTNLTLSFDWRTFSVSASDRLRVGYFVGDITAGNAGFTDRQIDLRNASDGGTDGDFNWGAGWIELAGFAADNTFSNAMYALSAAAGQSEVWIAFWLDGGENDFGKFDNVRVLGEAAVVPLPGAFWLLGGALLGLLRPRR
ncbi:MAG: hypothetical protein HKN70_02665 [Gammaproteobacteria bacterium]|nr:hypothetical protein [Gammaproteobacteria bacterium]